MNRGFLYLASALVIALACLPQIVSAADYAGAYDGTEISIVISRDGSNYTGEIRKGDQKFPLTASDDGAKLTGVFTASGASFNFTATRKSDDLTLLTGGATYQLHASPNPAASAQGPDALAGYIVLNTTDAGRSLVRELPNAKSTQIALRQTFPDLAKFFGSRPTILGAYEDQRGHTSAFVSFSAKLNGQAYKGFVTTRMRDQGAVVFVVYGRENATPAQWSALTAAPAATADSEEDLQSQMNRVPLTVHNFPDRTGSVGLAEGWTTNAQTESNLTITGPADQRIRMACGGTLYTIDSPTVQFSRQNGGQLNIPIAPYSNDPAVALANFTHANGIASQRNGGPGLVVNRIIATKEIPARNPGGHAAQITYDLTFKQPDGDKHYRVFIQFEVSPPVNGAWSYYNYLQLMSPPDTFKKDLPIMMAQAFSLNENAEAIAAKSRREIDAANKLAQAQRDANAKIAQSNYDRTKSVEDNEAIKMRSLTDFDETIRGVRTVEDTQSGQQTSVNLADVHDIVDNLNQQDPGRYREIPLRDEFYPLPGHENDPDYVGR